MRLTLPIVALIFLTGCQYNPYAHLFTTVQPKDGDVAGSYVLSHQRISPEGMSILQGKVCQLDLQVDGSFQVTNYPTWSDAFTPTNAMLTGLISTTGRWSCATVGTVSNGRTSKDHWGIVFSESDPKLESLDLTGNAPPYGLIMTYGDPDSGTVMIFERNNKSQDFTSEPAVDSEGFDVAFLIISVFMLLAMLAGCLLALIVLAVCVAIGTFLFIAGIVSNSILIGFIRKSLSSAFRAFFLQLGAVVGMVGGAAATAIAIWLRDANWNSPMRWALGITLGLLGGLLFAMLFNKIWSRVAGTLARKLKKPEKQLLPHSH